MAGNASHLQRALTGLIENALERSSADGAVTIECEEEEDAIVCRVLDRAPRMSGEAYEDAFSKFGSPTANASASAMRLYFCRIVIESCSGEVGSEAGEDGGNCFWIRLPKVAAQ